MAKYAKVEKNTKEVKKECYKCEKKIDHKICEYFVVENMECTDQEKLYNCPDMINKVQPDNGDDYFKYEKFFGTDKYAGKNKNILKAMCECDQKIKKEFYNLFGDKSEETLKKIWEDTVKSCKEGEIYNSFKENIMKRVKEGEINCKNSNPDNECEPVNILQTMVAYDMCQKTNQEYSRKQPPINPIKNPIDWMTKGKFSYVLAVIVSSFILLRLIIHEFAGDETLFKAMLFSIQYSNISIGFIIFITIIYIVYYSFLFISQKEENSRSSKPWYVDFFGPWYKDILGWADFMPVIISGFLVLFLLLSRYPLFQLAIIILLLFFVIGIIALNIYFVAFYPGLELALLIVHRFLSRWDHWSNPFKVPANYWGIPFLHLLVGNYLRVFYRFSSLATPTYFAPSRGRISNSDLFTGFV
jgi:hypothetical protein